MQHFIRALSVKLQLNFENNGFGLKKWKGLYPTPKSIVVPHVHGENKVR